MSRYNSRLIDIYTLVLLVAAGLKFTYGLEKIYDIGLYDETGYLVRGVNLPELLHDVITGKLAQVGPLYSAWYYLLSLLQPDRVKLYYLNYKILAILLPVFLYVVLRRYGVNVLVSVVVSFFVLISYANIATWPRVSHFMVIVVLISLIFASMVDDLVRRLGIAGMGALIGSYVRPEIFIAFVIMSVMIVIIVALRLKNRDPRGDIIFAGFIALVSMMLIAVMGAPMVGNRSWSAFEQHFALNWVLWTHTNDLSPWTNSHEIIKRSLGDVHSIPEAFMSNPDLFAKHVISNLFRAIKSLSIFFYHATVVFPKAFYKLEAILLFISFLLYLIVTRRGWMRALKDRVKEYRDLLLLAACYFVPAGLSALIIFPRYHYVLLPGILLVILVSVLITERKQNLDVKMNFKLLAFAGILFLAVTPPASNLLKYSDDTPIAKTIQFIRSLDISGDVNLLEANGGFDVYLGDNFHRVAEYQKSESEGFYKFLKKRHINAIILNDDLNNDARFRGDGDWHDFLRNYRDFGFVELPIPNTKWYFIVDKHLLGDL